MEKSKIVIIGPDPYKSKGGMATVIKNIAVSKMLNEFFEVSVYSSYISGSIYKRFPFSLMNLFTFNEQLINADIYHIHICSGTSTWRKRRYVSKIKNKSKVILHVHGAAYHDFFDQCTKREQQKIRDLFYSVGSVVVLSEDWKKLFLERSICSASKIHILYNGVYLPENINFCPREQILFMGQLNERKSPDTLLLAAAIVLKEKPDLKFVFAGDGNIDFYQKMGKQLGISDNCSFVGWVDGDERKRLLESSQVYCLPSKNEGMPMGILEAMAYGMVVIGTAVGGVTRVIKDKINGYIMPVGNYIELAEIILEIFDDPIRAKSIGMKAHETVESEFSMECFEIKLFEIYQEILK